MTSRFEKKVLVGLGLASVIIAGVTVVYHASTERLVESAGRVTETHALIAGLSDFESHLQTARMATRGYVMTGDESIYRLYAWARRDALSALGTLHDASSAEVHQRRAVEDIEQQAQERLSASEQLIQERRRTGVAPPEEAMTELYRDEAKDPLRDRVERLISEITEQLNDRQALARDNSNAMLWLLAFGAVVEFAFALAVAGVTRRYIRDSAGAAEALRRSEAMLRGFYDSGVAMMGIVETLDEEKDILLISANSAFATMNGARGPLNGQRASQIGTPQATVKLFLQKYRECLRENQPVQFEYQRETIHGKRWFMAVVSPIACAGGRPRFSFAMVDQTDRKAAEEAIRQHASELAATTAILEKQTLALEEARRAADEANAAKSNFLANMSHEIRTPMTAVVGYADLLGEPGRGDEQRKEWVGVIRRNARHLLELINDILDLSKIEAGKMKMQSVACDPAQIVADVVTMLRARAEQKGVTLRLDIEGPVPSDMGSDPLRLRQVMVNLISNAIKFTEVGEVSVRVSCDPPAPSDEAGTSGMLHIRVRDTGIGIKPAHLARLFKPFTQADETTTRRFGGTGLGLAISHRLMEMLGGSLGVLSEPGIGSTFTVTLPVREAKGEQSDDSSETASPLLYGQTEPVRLSGRILIAEDVADTQRLLSIVLTSAGAQISIAGDGREAVELALSQQFDLILMDMQMPQMDGYTATRELRRKGVKIPIIALTGNAMSGDRERTLAAGCDEYLTKPIDVPLLLARIAGDLKPAGKSTRAA